MQITMLGSLSSIHFVRWVNALHGLGHEINVVTVASKLPLVEDPIDPAIPVYHLPISAPFGYILNAWHLRRYLKRHKPAVLNSHYAGGFGTLARLSRFAPNVLMVYGSEIFSPDSHALGGRQIPGNLLNADIVCSTSNAMAKGVTDVAPAVAERLRIVPFGIDTTEFSDQPATAPPSIDPDAEIVIGTVKGLRHCYGIDILIKAFAHACDRLAGIDPSVASRLRLRIVGIGPDEAALKDLVQSLDLGDRVTFAGGVAHSLVPDELRKLDIYLALSRWESFGVAVLEASSVGLPVIVSDVGGLPEIVVANETGLVVPSEDVERAADAILVLVADPERCQEMGHAGAQHVRDRYAWAACVKKLDAVLGEAAALRAPNNMPARVR